MLSRKTKSPLFFFLTFLLLSLFELHSIGYEVPYPKTDLERWVEYCRDVCRQQSPRQQPRCETTCKRQYEEHQKKKEEERGRGNSLKESGSRSREEGQETRDENPYYFAADRLKRILQAEEGEVRLLERLPERSELFRGIENYRLSILETNPRTFSVPQHTDADSIIFILQGKGTITHVTRDGRESYNVEEGDVIKELAGTIVYFINRDDNEKLRLAVLFKPVNIPGMFQPFFAAGGEKPESFYRTFSNEVLESSFDTSRDELNKVFEEQKQGVFLKASREQLEALSQHASSTSQAGKESRGPFNLLKQPPIYSNQFGDFYEASPDYYTQQLQDLGISVTAVNIKQGAVMVPHYNSRSTTIVFITDGSGYFEMACPHLGSQREKGSEGREEQEKRLHYVKASSKLTPGDVFIIPAGHPVALVAYPNQNLRTIGFGINARNNQRNFLAGQDNVVNRIEKQAKKLAFNVSSEFVEQIFSKQQQSYFVAGRRQGGRVNLLASILDFQDFF